MVHDLQSFSNYFVALGAMPALDFKTVIVGGVDEILSLQNSAIRYPLLFVELPDERLQRDKRTIFETRIFALTNELRPTTAEYTQSLNAMRAKLLAVIAQLEDDSPTNFNFDPRELTIQYKEKMTGDLLHGAFCEINIHGVRPCN